MASLWQSASWSTMLEQSEQVEKIIELDFDFTSPSVSSLKGEGNNKVIFIEKRQVALGEFGLFILGFEGEISTELEQKLLYICKTEKALFIQIETILYFSGSIKNKKINNKYYKKFITPYTAVIDLELSEEDILKVMKPKGRYNIKVANKKGVTSRIVEKTDENIKIFHELMNETTARDGFSGNTFEYYKIFLQELEHAELVFSEVDNKIIAAGVFVFTEEVGIYYYGASTSEKQYRNYMAPYSLQWLAIQTAKERGCKLYDFLGVATPGVENDPLAGVTSFKGKLSQDFRHVSESHLIINKKLKYKLIKLLRKLKK